MSGNFGELVVQIVSVVVPVFSIIALGLFFARWQKNPDIRFVTEFITYIAAPALVFHSLLDEALTYDNFYPILASSFTVAILGIVFGLVTAKKLVAGSPAATLTVAFMNSGNMGLPICYFAFGKEGLAAATIFFVAMSIVHYTFGSVIAGGRGKLKEALLLPLNPRCNRSTTAQQGSGIITPRHRTAGRTPRGCNNPPHALFSGGSPQHH